MRNSKKECLRSTDSFIETEHFGHDRIAVFAGNKILD